MNDADVFYRVHEANLTIDYFMNSYLNTTLYSVVRPIRIRLGWLNIDPKAEKAEFSGSPEFFYSLKMNTYNELDQITDLPGPKFVFAHMLDVHTPYVMTEDGKYTGELPEDGKSYVQQIKYSNKTRDRDRLQYSGEVDHPADHPVDLRSRPPHQSGCRLQELHGRLRP